MKIFEVFGSILVDSDKADKSISKTGDKADSMGKKLGAGIKTAGKWGAALGGAALVASGAIFALGVKLGNTADELLDLNSITGMSTDNIQKWRKATEVAGVATDAMTNASKKLTKSLDTMSEGSNKGNEALEKLGLSLEEIESMSADERMNVLTESLAGVDDKTERARIGTDLFGNSWSEIAPVVDLGTEAMNKAKDSANIISEEDLKKANDFRIKVADMEEQLSFFVTEIAIAVMPILQIMMDWVQDKMPVIKATMETVFTAITTVITTVWTFISDNLIPIFTGLFDNVKGNFPIIKETFENVFKAIVEVAKTVWNFFKDNLLPIYVNLYEWIQGHMPTIKETITTVFNKIKEVATMVWSFFKDNILPILASLYGYIQDKMPQIQEIIETVFGIISDVVKVAWDIFENLLLPALKLLWDFISPTFPLIQKAVEVAFDAIFWAVDKVVGVFEGLVSIVKTAVDWLTSWNDKDVKDKNTTVHTNYTSSGGGITGGIPKYASGTDFHPGGMAIVGEKGAELINLPRGSSVKTASETKDMLAGKQPIILQTILNGRVIAEEIHADIGQLMGGRTNLNYAMKGV